MLVVLALLAMVLLVGVVMTPPEGTATPKPSEIVKPDVTVKGIICVGTVSLFPSQDVDKYQLFADLLAQRLTGWQHARGDVRFAPTMAAMAQLLESGEVDLYLDSPFPAITVAQLARSTPFMRRWKKGVAEYHSVVFTRSDSDIESIEDLAGEQIAFEEPFSTSGYFLPRTSLEQTGLHLANDAEWTGAPDVARYVFSRDDANTELWVRSGRVAAGACDHLRFETLSRRHPGELKVIARTPSVPRHVVSYRPGLSEKLLESVRETLTSLHTEEEGREILTLFSGTTRFDELEDGALRELENLVLGGTKR